MHMHKPDRLPTDDTSEGNHTHQASAEEQTCQNVSERPQEETREALRKSHLGNKISGPAIVNIFQE